MLSAALAVFEPESVTFAVKLYVPAVVAVPVMAPAALRLRPGGREPVSDQE
jgi:hypothetical protein